MCIPNTDTVAVLSYAAVFAAADNYLSGNFVPVGEAVPSGMVEGKMCVFFPYPVQSYGAV